MRLGAGPGFSPFGGNHGTGPNRWGKTCGNCVYYRIPATPTAMSATVYATSTAPAATRNNILAFLDKSPLSAAMVSSDRTMIITGMPAMTNHGI